MKNLSLIIIALLAFNTTQAQLITSLTTKAQGGVMGKVQSFVPEIGFYEAGTDLMEQTIIFNNIEVSMDEVSTIYTIDSQSGGENFQNFVATLTGDNDAILKVGHKVNKIKNHIGRSSEEWFETDMKGKEIGRIELIINKVDFATPGSNRTMDGNWTDFLYEITINIYGKDELMVQN